MAIRTLHDTTLALARIVAVAETPQVDWLSARADLLAMVRASALQRVLVDLRLAETLPATSYFTDAAALFRAELGDQRLDWAFVVDSPVSFGVARSFQSVADSLGMQVLICNTLLEAERWLVAERAPVLLRAPGDDTMVRGACCGPQPPGCCDD